MTGYFQDRLDYIFFFYGLSFLLLSVLCFFLKREKKNELAWPWLGYFGLAHGVNEWLDLTALSFFDNYFFSCVRLAVMSVSFIFLFEFARRSRKNVSGRAPGAWIYAVLLPLACLGGLYGFDGLNASVRYCLGFSAGLFACWAVGNSSRGLSGQLRYPLLMISAGLGAYAFATGAIVPRSELAPACWINYGSFMQFFGFPVQLLRGVLAFIIASGAWLYSCNLQITESGRSAEATYKGKIGWMTIATLALMISLGWIFTDYLGAQAKTYLMQDTSNRTSLLQAHLTQKLMKVEQAVLAMSGSPWILPALVSRSDQDVSRANSVLDRYCAAHGASVCYLIDASGKTLTSSNRGAADSFVGKSYVFRPYFQEAMAGKQGRYFALGITSGERGYYASAPVMSGGGRVVGVAVMKMSMESMEQKLVLCPESFLLSPHGVAFLSSRKDLTFRSLWPVPEAARAELTKSKQFGTLSFEPVWQKEIFDGTYMKYEGSGVYAARTPVGDEGWSILWFNSMHPVFTARFIGILASLSLCLLPLGFFVILMQSELRREEAMELLRLREEMKTLDGMLPICASCKKIRDDKGYWNRVETYITQHSEAVFSHSICPECVDRLYPGLDKAKEEEKK